MRNVGVVRIGLGIQVGVVPEAASFRPKRAIVDECISGGFPLSFSFASHLDEASHVGVGVLFEVGELVNISQRGGMCR